MDLGDPSPRTLGLAWVPEERVVTKCMKECQGSRQDEDSTLNSAISKKKFEPHGEGDT